MLIRIDYQDSRPIYEQIASGFEKLILSGVIEAGEQLPSVRSLAVELSTNPNTVQKAFAQLERDGFIYTVKGRGNFVKENLSLIESKKKEIIAKIRAILAEAEEMGISKKELLKSLED
ncbi:MAG: GntR family transcriptional regulator [Lachnospiraceae bacterium]|nr:GntR family transcriptional regulator [Lachnospiraceae bacterium]MDN4744185.1 GntR family transcriptional regulator [Lachnospiraceae bacterium C1.1]